MVEYTIVRSKRKTTAIYVRDGLVEVRAPLKMPVHAIDRFVTSKEAWINEKLHRLHEQTAQRKAFVLTYNSMVLYRGSEYPISARDGNMVGFDDSGFFIPPNLSEAEIRRACEIIYRMLAKNHLAARTMELAESMGLSPSSIKINGAKTRWGSCSAKKSVNYSWRLIMAEDPVIDYVIVHELSHLKELDHSARFWAVVENVLPDYKERKAKLTQLQNRMSAENW